MVVSRLSSSRATAATTTATATSSSSTLTSASTSMDSYDSSVGIQLTERQLQMRQRRREQQQTASSSSSAVLSRPQQQQPASTTRRAAAAAVQPFGTQSNRVAVQANEQHHEKGPTAPRSVAASTSVLASARAHARAAADQKARLREKALNKSKQQQTTATRSSQSFQKQASLQQQQRQEQQSTSTSSSNSGSATPYANQTAPSSIISDNAGPTNSNHNHKSSLPSKKSLRQRLASSLSQQQQRPQQQQQQQQAQTSLLATGSTSASSLASTRSLSSTTLQQKALLQKAIQAKKGQNYSSTSRIGVMMEMKSLKSSKDGGTATTTTSADSTTAMLDAARRRRQPMIGSSTTDSYRSIIDNDKDDDVHSFPNDDSMRMNDDSSDYRAFVENLKREVAADHTELWNGFQLLFDRHGSSKASSKSSLVAGMGEGKQPKRSKLDPATRKVLMEMNLHLKRSHAVECMVETQLVNDKQLAKQRQQQQQQKQQQQQQQQPTETSNVHVAGGGNAVVADSKRYDKRASSFTIRDRVFAKRFDSSHRHERQHSLSTIGSSSSTGSTTMQSAATTTAASTTRLHLEAVKQRIVAKDEEQQHWASSSSRIARRQSSIGSVASNIVVINNVAPKSEQDAMLPEWPDANDHSTPNDSHDDSPRTSDLSNKENWQYSSSQIDGEVSSSIASSLSIAGRQYEESKAAAVAAATTTGTKVAENGTAEYQRQKSWLTNYREKQAMGSTSLLDQSIDSQPEHDDEDCSSSGSLPSRPMADSEVSVQPQSSRASIASNGRRTSLLDTVLEDGRITPDEVADDVNTPRSLSGRKRSITDDDSFTSGPNLDGQAQSSVVPWANVKLRSTRKPLTTDKFVSSIPALSSGESQSPSSSSSLASQETDSEVPPWTQLKLRSVTKSHDASTDTASNLVQQEDVLSFRKQLRKVPSELNAVKKREMESKLAERGITRTPEKKSLADLSWAPVNRQATVSKPRKSTVFGICKGDDVDLRSVPPDVFGCDNETVIVDLDRIPGMPEEHKLSIVIGKNVLLEARTVNGEQLSRVNWRVSRSDVKSISLDMADRRADIALTGGNSKSLVFDSAEGCLRFANAFYETTSTTSANPVHDGECADSLSDESGNVPDRVVALPASEQLTEEEEQLLEAFRQRRKKTSTAQAMIESMAVVQSSLASASEKDNLNRVSPGKEAKALFNDVGEKSASSNCEESKSSQSPNIRGFRMITEEGNDLSTEEETLVETYRKMLKLRIPPDAVRHKMTKDQVDARIVDAVFNSALEQTSSQDPGKLDALSEEEEQLAESYRKMLKMMIPANAVRHKMKKDQASSNVVVAVFGRDVDSSCEAKHKDTALSEEEEKHAESYRKMLKMMIPADAVRHKMKKDQASSNVVVAVFGRDVDSSCEAKDKSQFVLSDAEEAVAASYRKMLKMMIPPDAVRHKMKKDQVESKIIIAVFGPDPNDEKKKAESFLSDADDKIAETYRKMLRMKVPTEGVRHKMMKDSVSQHIIAAVLGAENGRSTNLQNSDCKKEAQRGSKLVSLHWTPLSGEALDNSIWRASKKRKVTVAQPEGSDISKLVELFQKKTNKRIPSAAAGAGGNGRGDGMAKLIDLNRANNIAISLKAFKEFSHVELAETIAHLDPLQRITGERVQFVKDLLPTPTEVKVVKAYKGEESRLVPAEVFFTKMVRISRLQTKIQVLQTMDTLNDNATELGKNFVLLETVCLQIMNSVKLEEVLDMVLQIGNIMNEGTRTGGAAGFKFDSLLKLTQTKSSDGKMTVLDYIVMIFVAKEKRETLQLTADFPDCQAASRMLITEMVNDVTSMKSALAKCESELENLKKDNGETAATDNDPRAALMAALKKRASGADDELPKSFAKRAAFLAAIEAQKPKEPVELDGWTGKKQESPAEKKQFVAKDASLKSGIQRLEAFTSEATGVLKRVEEERDRAIDACKSLSRYCGESGGERATVTLIGILSQFATNLESAVTKHDQRREAESRREAAAQKKKEQPDILAKADHKSDANYPASNKELRGADPSTKGQSLVLMVNALLKEAPDSEKDDFKNGVVYEDPDEKLRAIYKKERESLGIFVPPDARKPSQVDLLIAIKKRRERAEAKRESNVPTKSCDV